MRSLSTSGLVGAELHVHQICQSHLEFESHFWALKITDDVDLELDVQKSLEEFKVRQYNFFTLGKCV
jgi:hypothetical protein